MCRGNKEDVKDWSNPKHGKSEGTHKQKYQLATQKQVEKEARSPLTWSWQNNREEWSSNKHPCDIPGASADKVNKKLSDVAGGAREGCTSAFQQSDNKQLWLERWTHPEKSVPVTLRDGPLQLRVMMVSVTVWSRADKWSVSWRFEQALKQKHDFPNYEQPRMTSDTETSHSLNCQFHNLKYN